MKSWAEGMRNDADNRIEIGLKFLYLASRFSTVLRDTTHEALDGDSKSNGSPTEKGRFGSSGSYTSAMVFEIKKKASACCHSGLVRRYQQQDLEE